MKRKWATIYAVFCLLLLAAGFIALFSLALARGTREAIACLCGLLLGFVFAPTVHEIGHICMGKSVNFTCVYVKCFCVKVVKTDEKRKISFASPFAVDETQMLPKNGGEMQKRAWRYTLGGILFSGGFCLLVLLVALLTGSFTAWGALPYATYLFLLNALPAEYAGGKTDALVCRGIRRGGDAERCMLAAMEIQGRLFEGQSFGEIPKAYYFDLPQLAEDEPLYAILLDLRYRYYLDIGDFDGAADCLNRLVSSQAYLSDDVLQNVLLELVYMHSMNGDLERAKESEKLARDRISKEDVAAKRALACFLLVCGDAEYAKKVKAEGMARLERVRISGVKKFEETLLNRIQIAE